MYKKALVLSAIPAAAAGSIELSSSDLTGSNRALDNIKATWSQSLKVLGNDATLTGNYDRRERDNFLKDATLSGAISKVKYELTTKFAGASGLSLETTTDDGTTLAVEGDLDHLVGIPKLTKLSAVRSVSLNDRDCDLEIEHEPASSQSKLKLSTVLGSGVKAIGTLTSNKGSHSTGYEVEYDTNLSDGRSLSASVNPKDGSGSIEYVDSSTVDGTLTATIPLGGEPSLTLKRSFSF